jgi:hypothetical protein
MLIRVREDDLNLSASIAMGDKFAATLPGFCGAYVAWLAGTECVAPMAVWQPINATDANNKGIELASSRMRVIL